MHKPLMSRYAQFGIPSLWCVVLGGWVVLAFPERMAIWSSPVWLGGVLLGLIALVVMTRQRWILWAAGFLLAFTLGMGIAELRAFHPTPGDVGGYAPMFHTALTGTVQTVEAPKNRFRLAVDAVGSAKAHGTVYVKAQTLPELGSTVQLTGSLQKPFSAWLPGQFDYQHYLLHDGITALVRAKNIVVLHPPPRNLWQMMNTWVLLARKRIEQTFDQTLPQPQSAVMGGIVLGDYAIPVDTQTQQEFVHSGLVHLLAASGMNISLVAAFLYLLLYRLPIPRWSVYCVMMLAVAAYSVLTGLPPSVMRAASMLEIALALKILDKSFSPAFLLAIVSTLLFVWNPDVVMHISFQLSVLTTLGIIAMGGPLIQWLGYYITEWAAGILLIPLVAQLWILPISIQTFHQFSLLSLPANVIAVPLSIVLTYLGFSAGVMCFVFPWGASLLSHLSWPFVTVLVWIAKTVDSLPFSWLAAPSGPILTWMTFYIMLCVGILALHHPQLFTLKRWGLIACALGCGLFIPISLSKWAQSQQAEWIALPGKSAPSAVFLSPGHDPLVLLTRFTPTEGRLLSTLAADRGIRRFGGILIPKAYWTLPKFQAFLQQYPTNRLYLPAVYQWRLDRAHTYVATSQGWRRLP